MARRLSPCPLCGFNESSPFYGYAYKGTGRIRRENRVCNRCGAIHQASIPTFAELAEYYARYLRETLSDTVDIPLYFEEIVLSIGRMRADIIAPFLRDGSTGLDIGCSFGGLMKVLRDESGHDITITGLNPEPGPAAFAKEQYGLEVQTGMFEDVEIPEASLDFVILDNVIEHFIAPSDQLARIHRLLNENGVLIIFTNNAAELHGFPWQNFFDDHTITYTPATLKAQLESTGFQTVRLDSSGHVTYEGYHYPYLSCIARKGSVPEDYDFSRNGESPDAVVDRLKRYARAFYREDRWAKMAFEMEHAGRGGASRLLAGCCRVLAGLSGQREYVLHNHTLPPEEYFQRRVVLIRAGSDEDDALGIRLALESGLNPEYVVLREDGGGLRVAKATPFIRSRCGNVLPEAMADCGQAWGWLDETLPGIAFKIGMDIQAASPSGPHIEEALAALASGQTQQLTIHNRDFRRE